MSSSKLILLTPLALNNKYFLFYDNLQCWFQQFPVNYMKKLNMPIIYIPQKTNQVERSISVGDTSLKLILL